MLLQDIVLAKRGPLAKIWLSAHQERKLSKQQTLGVDVTESVDAILTQDEVTLRVSGQLMLGVVRIYGRKTQYLLDDCKETRERISMAFRPGIVDLPQDQIRASKNAITFTDATNIDSADILDWSFHVPAVADLPPAPRGLHTAPLTQTNMREYGAFNFGRPAAPSIYGDSGSRQGSVDDHDSTSHLDSQNYDGINLGLGDWDEEWALEEGREAQTERSRSRSILQLRSPSVVRDDHHQPMDVDHGGDTFEPMPLDISFDLPDLDGGAGDLGGGDGDDDDRARRASSALSTPPPQSPKENGSTVDVTPRTAKRIADAQAAGKPAKRVRVVRADAELDLPDEEFAPPQEGESDILGVQRYIPADPDAVRLFDIIDDPASHFLPTIRVGAEAMIFAGPAGLAPELAELFTFPVNVLRRHREEDEAEATAAKRPRIEGSGSPDVEEGRRNERLPSEAGFGFDFDTGMDHGVGDMSFDFGGLASPPPRPRAPSVAPSVAESAARAVQFGEAGDHPLACFDTRTRNAAGEFESQQSDVGMGTQSQVTSSQAGESSGGFSKTTGMAMGVLRRELEAIEAASTQPKPLSFDKVAHGATKRAASAFFFELLVLGTRDCVRLDQHGAFGDIDVSPKPKLWESAAPPSTAASFAPPASTAASFA